MSDFKCPVCGGSFFTTPDLSVTPWVRHCRGPAVPVANSRRFEYAGCEFTWPETHDARYGLENLRVPQE